MIYIDDGQIVDKFWFYFADGTPTVKEREKLEFLWPFMSVELALKAININAFLLQNANASDETDKSWLMANKSSQKSQQMDNKPLAFRHPNFRHILMKRDIGHATACALCSLLGSVCEFCFAPILQYLGDIRSAESIILLWFSLAVIATEVEIMWSCANFSISLKIARIRWCESPSGAYQRLLWTNRTPKGTQNRIAIKRINANKRSICYYFVWWAIKSRSIIDCLRDFNCVTFDFREETFSTVDWCRSENHQSCALTHIDEKKLPERTSGPSHKSNDDWHWTWKRVYALARATNFRWTLISIIVWIYFKIKGAFITNCR